MCDIMGYVKGLLTSMYTLIHMNDDLVNKGALKGVLKCILNKIVIIHMLCPCASILSHDLGW